MIAYHDLLDRCWQRWRDDVRCYAALSWGRVILPRPTAAMRFYPELLSAAPARINVPAFRRIGGVDVLDVECAVRS
jgi:hypothetical protein